MSNEQIKYPSLPPLLQGGFRWGMLKYFGAGAIITSVTIGSGETLFASRGGAVFGYTLLWCFVAGALMKGVQVYSAARYITLTGEHPMRSWGYLPGPRNWVPLLIGILSIICFPFWLGGLPLILGETVNWIFHVAEPQSENFGVYARTWGTLIIIIAATLTMLQSYSILEKVQTVIVGLLLTSLAVACIACQPDWLAAMFGAIVPRVPEYADWIVVGYPEIAQKRVMIEVIVYLGVIGGGTYDYIGYIGCLREKKWGALALNRIHSDSDDESQGELLPIDTSEENIRRGRRWLVPAKIDTGIGFLCIMLFTVFFVVLGAAILHPQHLVPTQENWLTHQALFLTNIHPSLLYLYQIGIFMAFWGTIYGAYEVYSRTAYECLAPLSKRVREMPMRRVRLFVVLYCAIGGLILMWGMKNPLNVIEPAAVVGGVLTCGLWCFAMLWTDRRFLPKPLQMGTILTILMWISGTILTIAGVKATWDVILHLFGGE